MTIVTDEKELRKIFGMENIEDDNEVIREKFDVSTKVKMTIPVPLNLRNQYAEEAIKNGLLDLEIWNKIVRYEKEHANDTEVKNETREEEMIRKCLLICPGNRFVNGVKTYFEKTGKVSEKQMEALERIYESGKIGEEL